ncbi:follicle-stimulating hormone receptor-like [Actinia tenebrosa]|uniref:Follicle-stimulating hormone receptor-like n=1 Tax=Actinia tenebrosa TaxID=6105 RepID=A0A6P8HFH8_ACTTE|nr:follicle-stimulating hormone receptor-like [Actinia tenebrosa]
MNLSGNTDLDLSLLNFTNMFPRLTVLDVSGIPNWLNSSHVKETLGMLQVIRGTPLDGQCLRCFLKKNSNTLNISLAAGPWMNAEPMKPPLQKYSGCYGNILYFKDQYYLNFQRLGYDISCQSVDFRCFNGYSKLSFFHNYNVEPLNRCWDQMNQSSGFLFVLATVAITLNLTVVIATVRSKVLRDNVAQFLVSNVAMGDMFMSFYLLLITTTRASVTYREMMDLLRTPFCYFVGFVNVMSQGISAFSSFVVSVERYLAVVYCMDPNIRIFPHVAKCCLAIVVFISFVFSILPFTVLSSVYVPDSHCTPVSEPTSGAIEYMTIPGGLVMIAYFLTLPMYTHMYISVRSSSQVVGIQREGRVARKIALIVFSNMAFFLLPLLFLTLVNYTALGDIFTMMEKGIFWKTFMYYSFATNACLNPILFAFRNEKFRQELKRQLHLTPITRVGLVQPPSHITEKTSKGHQNKSKTTRVVE